MVKTLQPIFVCLVAVVLGLWLGEHPGAPPPTRDLLILLVVAIAAASALWSTNRLQSVLASNGTAIVFCLPWLVGRSEATYAFNGGVQNAEQVRESVASYRAANGSFPTALSELGIRIPGELTLPPHTLRYRRNSKGYSLSFSDWLVNHEATEAQGFEIHK